MAAAINRSKNKFFVGDSAPPSGELGQLFYNTTAKKYFVWEGTTWKDIGGGAPRTFDAVVDASGNGDYSDIPEAVDAGARSIFLKKGYYNGCPLSRDMCITIFGEGILATVIRSRFVLRDSAKLSIYNCGYIGTVAVQSNREEEEQLVAIYNSLLDGNNDSIFDGDGGFQGKTTLVIDNCKIVNFDVFHRDTTATFARAFITNSIIESPDGYLWLQRYPGNRFLFFTNNFTKVREAAFGEGSGDYGIVVNNVLPVGYGVGYRAVISGPNLTY